MFKNIFFLENCAVNEIKLKGIVGPVEPQMTNWRARITCLMPRAINTQLEYVIILAFQWDQSLHERVSM